jgi:hypothetical protein
VSEVAVLFGFGYACLLFHIESGVDELAEQMQVIQLSVHA